MNDISKIIGVIITVASTTLYGYIRSMELTVRLKTLRFLKHAFVMLQGEIRCMSSTLPEAFENVYKNCIPGEENVRDFFYEICRELQNGKDNEFNKIWENSVLVFAEKTFLCDEHKDKLLRLGSVLGYLDIDQQINSIDMYLCQLDEDLDRLVKSYYSTCKLYMGLGVMAGLFIAIILI